MSYTLNVLNNFESVKWHYQGIEANRTWIIYTMAFTLLVLRNIFKELPNFPILCPLLVHSHMESTCRSINLLMPCIILAKFGSIWQKLKCLMNWSFFNYFLGDFSLSQFSLSWVFQILCLVILYLSNDNLGTMKCITVRVKFDWVV